MIAHVVLFQPKPGVSDEARTAFLGALETACGTIAGVRRARVGRRLTLGVGYEQRVDPVTSRFDYAAIVEFDRREDLLAYLAEPAHDTLGRLFWDLCESTSILDLSLTEVSDPAARHLLMPD